MKNEKLTDTTASSMEEGSRTSSMEVCHIIALPYPGRGHINPMMNTCKQLVSKKPEILITFVITDEWFGFIGSDSKPDNIRFLTLPNVIPSELIRCLDFPAFIEAVFTKLEDPFEKVLDRMRTPVTAIIADIYLPWATDVGERRNIPVVSFCPMSATVFSILFHYELLLQHLDFPIEVSEHGEERVDCIPGVSSIRISDLPFLLLGTIQHIPKNSIKAVLSVRKAKYLLFASVYELESLAIDGLKPNFPFPIRTIGPSIPYNDLEQHKTAKLYLQWLDSQPDNSVLYISSGSFLSASASQIDEIAAGIRASGIRYFWVARGGASSVEVSDLGLVVPWCDQLRVLRHASIGGFWTHCGWNSTMESVFAGVPMLTFPIMIDQMANGKKIVEDWKIGWRVKRKGNGDLVKREEISELVRRFIESDEDEEVMKMRGKAKEIGEVCRKAIGEDGSSDTNLNAFINDILSL